MHDPWEMQRREREKHCTKLGKNKSEVHKNNHNHKTGFITVFRGYEQKTFANCVHTKGFSDAFALSVSSIRSTVACIDLKQFSLLFRRNASLYVHLSNFNKQLHFGCQKIPHSYPTVIYNAENLLMWHSVMSFLYWDSSKLFDRFKFQQMLPTPSRQLLLFKWCRLYFKWVAVEWKTIKTLQKYTSHNISSHKFPFCIHLSASNRLTFCSW